MVMEIFTIFLPCWQAYRHRALQQETLDLITAWETRCTYNDQSSDLTGTDTSSKTRTGSNSYVEKKPNPPSTVRSEESLFSMVALERLLAANPEPLRRFSALKDFSGENVVFLTSVAEWKRSYPVDQGDEAIRSAYVQALGIFTKFISPRYADCPVNISFQERNRLEATFEKAARLLYGERTLVNDPASPFTSQGEPCSSSCPSSSGSQRLLASSSDNIHELRSSMARISYWGEIPTEFGPTCFDQAEGSIKYLVLTNTWPKFLKSSDVSLSMQELSPQERGKSWGTCIASLLSCEV